MSEVELEHDVWEITASLLENFTETENPVPG